VATYQLHPALLDFATSFLRLFKSTGSYLPLSYKRLLIRRPLPTRLYSYARYTPGTHQQGFTLSFDITLFDEHGEVLVEIEEFSVIKVQDIEKLNTTTRSHLPPNLFLPQADAPLTSSALAFSDNLQTGMTPTEGVEVFRRVLSSTLPHVVISTYDLAKRQAQAYKQSRGLLAGSAAGDDPQKTRHPRPALPGAYAPPQTRTQEKLATIWQAVLGIEQVGIHDNFFELGGDSLLITQIYSQFQQNFEHDISIAKLLQYPTIADLAAFLQQSAGEESLAFTEIAERTSKQKAARQRRGQAMAHHRNKLAQGEKQ
jgi:polyketide synthase PksJ